MKALATDTLVFLVGSMVGLSIAYLYCRIFMQ